MTTAAVAAGNCTSGSGIGCTEWWPSTSTVRRQSTIHGYVLERGTRGPQVPIGCLRIGLGGRGHRLASASKFYAGKKTQHCAGVLILILILKLQGSH